ncbi:MAG: response regulator [Candidatus Methylophosphatis roskildensis]
MKRILIVDDEPHVSRVLKLTLERAGYAVRTEPDGQAALASVLAEPPDAMITDIQMPRLNGRELMKMLHELMPERLFPVMVMTSMTAREEREWVREMPGIEFLEKPLSPRQLVARLNRHFGNESTNGGVTSDV